MAQLRKAADRKRVHRGSRTPKSLHDAAAELAPINGHAPEVEEDDVTTVAGMEVQGDGPLVVREKVHTAVPMTLDQALEAMELVGHDFYLFIDSERGIPERGLPPSRLRLRRDPAGQSHLDGEAVNGAARESGILVESAH